MNKKRVELRSALIEQRRSIDTTLRRKWDGDIAQQVLDWCRQHPFGIAGIYSPIQAEPSLAEVLPQLTALGIRLALPAAPVRDQALQFAEWRPGDELMKDRFGVLVPLESAPILKPDVLFIPCVGFTSANYRLGYGGGFYDRTLAQAPRPRTVGIAYRISECELDVQPHDIALDFIITNRQESL